MIVRVLVLAKGIYDYAAPDFIGPLNAGDYVICPVRNKPSVGIVLEIPENPYQGKLLEIIAKCDIPAIDLDTFAFIKWMSSYYLIPQVMIIKMCIGAVESFILKCYEKAKKSKSFALSDLVNLSCFTSKTADIAEDDHYIFDLNPEQEVAINKISIDKFGVFVIEGVTGSGKTAVYTNVIHQALSLKKKVLIMLPEIALNSTLKRQYEKIFGNKVAVWHSSLTEAQRREVFRRSIDEKEVVIIGTRSALFLPFKDLGLIVVDEEHEGAYKQEQGICYNARDMAIVRSKIHNIPILLVSATPSLETIYGIKHKGYQHIVLNERYGDAQMPEMYVIDQSRSNPLKSGWISEELQYHMQNNHEDGQQTLLFINRRGYSPLVICTGCGHRLSCNKCSSYLVYHAFLNRAFCHHCLSSISFNIRSMNHCNKCAEPKEFKPCGLGVERIAEEVQSKFPEMRVGIFSSDFLTTPKKIDEFLHKVQSHEIDIIVGTQMVAKGHHFPKLSCVGVLDADIGFLGIDFRMIDKTYQTLTQVAGRAGRTKDYKGKVFIQTTTPHHPLIEAIKTNNVEFLREFDLSEREKGELYPFTRLIALILEGKDEKEVEQEAFKLTQMAPSIFKVLGPIPAPIAKINYYYRWRILVKVDININFQKYLRKWLEQANFWDHHKRKGVKLIVDIDPYSFY